jgi:hypothetical protein
VCAQANNKKLQLGECRAVQGSFEDACGLEVNVVFTTEQGTVAALRTAGNLARQLNAGIRLLVTQVVPYALPLDRPKVSVGFIQDRCRSMALECTGVTEIRVNVYLCRNRSQALRRVLSANSLVIVGGRRRWWHGAEQKLAKMLEADGHQVIFADVRPDRWPTKRAFPDDTGPSDQPDKAELRLTRDGSVGGVKAGRQRA